MVCERHPHCISGAIQTSFWQMARTATLACVARHSHPSHFLLGVPSTACSRPDPSPQDWHRCNFNILGDCTCETLSTKVEEDLSAYFSPFKVIFTSGSNSGSLRRGKKSFVFMMVEHRAEMSYVFLTWDCYRYIISKEIWGGMWRCWLDFALIWGP